MAQSVKSNLYGKNHPSNAPPVEPVEEPVPQGTAMDYLFDGGASPKPQPVPAAKATLPPAVVDDERSAHMAAIRQSVGPAPRLTGPNASTTEVTCAKCLKTLVPERRWAGTSLVTTLIATIIPIGVAIVLVIAGRAEPHVDADLHRIVIEPGLDISLTAWIVSLVASFVPAAVYAGWRIREARWVCRACGNENVWAADSAVGKLLKSKRLALKSAEAEPIF